MSKHHIFIVQLLGLVLLTSSFSYARVCFPGIGDKAPSFTAQSTEGKIRFPGDYKGKWIIFFSHPADFTPVCTTEFKRLAGMADEFKKLNTVIVGSSVDSAFTHKIWEKKA